MLAGVGIARLSLFPIAPDIRAGRLVPILEDFNPGDTEEINVIFLGQGGHLPSRVRALIDFLPRPRRASSTSDQDLNASAPLVEPTQFGHGRGTKAPAGGEY